MNIHKQEGKHHYIDRLEIRCIEYNAGLWHINKYTNVHKQSAPKVFVRPLESNELSPKERTACLIKNK